MPSLLSRIQRRIQNPVKHLTWSFCVNICFKNDQSATGWGKLKKNVDRTSWNQEQEIKMRKFVKNQSG